MARSSLIRLMNDYREARKEGFLVEMDPENIYRWKVMITGPPNTPYEQGRFSVSICTLESFVYL